MYIYTYIYTYICMYVFKDDARMYSKMTHVYDTYVSM